MAMSVRETLSAPTSNVSDLRVDDQQKPHHVLDGTVLADETSYLPRQITILIYCLGWR